MTTPTPTGTWSGAGPADRPRFVRTATGGVGRAAEGRCPLRSAVGGVAPLRRGAVRLARGPDGAGPVHLGGGRAHGDDELRQPTGDTRRSAWSEHGSDGDRPRCPRRTGTPRRRVSAPGSTPPCWSRVAWCPQTCWARRRRRSRRGLCPIPARRGDLRPRLPAHHTTSSLRPQPGAASVDFGTGGAVGFADPAAEVAVGYVMNDVIPRWQSTPTGPSSRRRTWSTCRKRGRSDYIDPACDRRSTAGPPRPSARARSTPPPAQSSRLRCGTGCRIVVRRRESPGDPREGRR